MKPVKEEVKNRPFKPYYLFNRKMLALFPLIFGANFLQAQVFTAMNIIIVSLFGMGLVAFFVFLIKISNIIGSFSSGTLAGWFSKMVLLVILIFMSLGGIFLLVGTHTRVWVLLGVILSGFAMAAIYPVCLVWLKEKFPAEEYLYALGIFHVYNNLGVLGAILSNLKMSAEFSFVPGIAAFFLALPGIALFNKLSKNNIIANK
ncbi:MAG: MFS transporter [Candidatus Staskawiczbacteria bacterium]|nr:MFS transporter [Candidatus Staskawiczbacteria bacterium]